MRLFVIALLAGVIFVLTYGANRAFATPVTWFGPGFYGNAFACSHLDTVPNKYSMIVRGAAHSSWPCNTRVKVACTDFSLCKQRWIVVRIIDRCRCTLDLTQRSMQDMTGGKHYTIKARYWRVPNRTTLRPTT